MPSVKHMWVARRYTDWRIRHVRDMIAELDPEWMRHSRIGGPGIACFPDVTDLATLMLVLGLAFSVVAAPILNTY